MFRKWALLMAVFSRLCLIAAVGALWMLLVFSLIYVIAVAPGLLVLAGAVAFMCARRQFRGGRWAFGTGRFASSDELARAGVLSADTGLLIGKVAAPRMNEAARLLTWLPWTESEAACLLFLNTLSGRRDGMWARLSGGTHAVAIAPTGRGKGTALVVNNLLTYPGSVVVVDPKGENAQLTADYRRRHFGHEIIFLDPYRLVTQSPDTFNVLDGIDKRSSLALDAVQAIAEALVIRTGQEKEPHWGDSAELWIWAVTALVLYQADPEARNLQTVAKILADPLKLNAAVEFMKRCEAWNGLLARLGEQLQHFVDRELGSTLTTTNRFLRFLNTMAIMASTQASSFDPVRLRDGKMSIYLILPMQYLRTQSPLLRLWISSLLRSTIGPVPDERTKTLWLLDEAASLGHLPCIDDAVERLRGFGTRLFFFYQSMGQLEQCFPGRSQVFLSNMDHSIFFGVNDLQTATAVSERLGASTVATWSENGGRSRNHNHGETGLSSWSTSSNDGYGISETGRKVLTPDEVLNLGPRQAIVFTPGLRPVLVRLVRYYEREFRSALDRRRGTAALRMSLRSLFLASFMVGLAAVGIALIESEWRRTLGPQQSLPSTQPVGKWQEQTSPWTFPGAADGNPFGKGHDNATKNRRGPR